MGRTGSRSVRRRRGPDGCCRLQKCPETCTGASGRRVPEKTRTRDSLPTYGSEVVLMTSASSGPSGVTRERFEHFPQGSSPSPHDVPAVTESLCDQLQTSWIAKPVTGLMGISG